jgi:hypothetical protein
VTGPLDIDDPDGLLAITREAWARADSGDPEELVRICAPDLVFRPYMASLDTPEVQGVEELRRWNRDFHGSFDVTRTLRGFERVSDTMVLGRLNLSIQARIGGLEIDQEFFGPVEIVDGWVTWFAVAPDRVSAEALISRRMESSAKPADQ